MGRRLTILKSIFKSAACLRYGCDPDLEDADDSDTWTCMRCGYHNSGTRISDDDSNIVNLGDYRDTTAINFYAMTDEGDEVILMSLRGDGEILVKGKPVVRDIDVVDAMRDFLRRSGYGGLYE